MTNAEYFGFTSNGKFTKNINHIPKKVKDMNTLEFLKWLSSEKVPELTASEKKFLTDFVNYFTWLTNIQTVTRIYDGECDTYFLRFQSSPCTIDTRLVEMSFSGLEENKSYNIRELLGKD